MMSVMRNIWETHAGNDKLPGNNDVNLLQKGVETKQCVLVLFYLHQLLTV